MNEKQRFISFYDENSDNFYELFDSVRSYLKNNNEDYKELHKQIHKILDSNINLQKLLDDEVLEDGFQKKNASLFLKFLIYIMIYKISLKKKFILKVVWMLITIFVNSSFKLIKL